MEFTYFGHSCFLIEVKGKKLLFDPFISGNELAKDIKIEDIKADYIFVSHGHEDHTGDLLRIASNTQATVIAVFEIAEWLKRNGYNKLHPMNFGSFEFDFGEVRMTPATHSSSLPDGTYAGNPGGFYINTHERSFYYSGDTSLTLEMQFIPYYGKVDIAILPVGGNFTMDVKDAIKATELIQTDKVIGVHFDTFDAIKIDHAKSESMFIDRGKKLILPKIGQTITI